MPHSANQDGDPDRVVGYQHLPDYGDGKFVTDQDSKGMIDKRENGKVLVMFAGGNEVWYDEKDISYPDMPNE